MSKFNQTNTNKTVNKSGHPAYKTDDELKLTTMVLTTMFGERKYYGDNTNELVQLAKQVDGEFVSQLAVYARKEFHMRSVSHALTAIVANREDTKELIRFTVDGVVERVDDITEILACYISMYGKPIPNGLKRALAAQMNKFGEYQFAKYNGGNKAVKLRDVLRLTHAKPKDNAQSELFKKVIDDTLEIPYTWETELSAKGNTKEVWEQLIDSGKVGYMALLRNLRNILKCQPKNLDKVLSHLSDAEEVKKSKQLPFRFFSAYNVVKKEGLATSKVLDALETAIRHSVENMEKIKGRTLIAIDTSGSMSNNISAKSDIQCVDIARLMAVMANSICEDAEAVAFDTGLYLVTVPSVGGIIQNALSIRNNGGGTDITLPLRYALQEKKQFDRLIMFSDNEINSAYRGYNTCQSFADEYRRKINPDFWVHAIDLQGYGTQQFIGGNTNIIAGWSEKVLEFIGLAELGVDSIVAAIRNYQ